MQITVISGTNRAGNLSLKVAGICQEILTKLGLESSLLDLRELPDSLASQYYNSGVGPEFVPFQDLIEASTHFVFVVPEYNGSMPGVLKLFIDACKYPDSFKGKSALMIGIAAGSGGNAKGLEHLRDVLVYLEADVHPERLAIAGIREKLQVSGKFNDETAEMALQNLLKGYLNVVEHL